MKGLVKKLKNLGKATAVALPMIFSSYDSKAQIVYGDQVLKPDEAPFYKNQGKEHLNFYGSGDADGNDTLDFRDYSAMSNNTKNDRTDVNGDGVTNSSDAALFKKYLDHDIKYLPGHWKYLQERNERVDWLKKMISIDKTDEMDLNNKYGLYGLTLQANINFPGIENITGANLSASTVDTTKNMRFNIPMYTISTLTSQQKNYQLLTTLIGDDPTNLEDWYFFDPQTDKRVFLGDSLMDKGGHLRISRDAYVSDIHNSKLKHRHLPILIFTQLNKDTPTVNFKIDSLKESRDIFPINFNLTTLPDTLINYFPGQKIPKLGQIQNIAKGDTLIVTDSFGQIMNKGFEQVNYDNQRYFHVKRGLVIDTLLKQTIKVRDLEAPKFGESDNLVEYITSLTNINPNYLEVTDNSNLYIEKSIIKSSNQESDPKKIGHYEYSENFLFSATDITGNKSDTTLERKVLKPNTLTFKYLPKDTTIFGNPDTPNLKLPTVIDTLFKNNNIKVNPLYIDLNNGSWQAVIAARGEGSEDSIFHTYNIKSIPIGIQEISNKDNTPAYPNPTNSITNAVFDANYSGNGRVELWGMGGQKLEDNQINVKSGENTIPVDLSQYSDGMYLFRIFDKDGNLIEDNKLIKN